MSDLRLIVGFESCNPAPLRFRYAHTARKRAATTLPILAHMPARSDPLFHVVPRGTHPKDAKPSSRLRTNRTFTGHSATLAPTYDSRFAPRTQRCNQAGTSSPQLPLFPRMFHVEHPFPTTTVLMPSLRSSPASPDRGPPPLPAPSELPQILAQPARLRALPEPSRCVRALPHAPELRLTHSALDPDTPARALRISLSWRQA